ncbi:outer membrane protein [Sphingomonas abietis]|uniref:Outer membrane beta-barrel protein n=1 Tax=Sphingomonas abietis TaxID=3012344 RepID=A0ABY7NMX7_9SPHN|nr:outer membrane beta-barrel protein [Sphingomonas abietis]WBO21937.1 outer membrane beta-barrel protein [Sphingomonas abietis]
MKKFAFAALFAASTMVATAAMAQDTTTSFRGFRVEGNAGYDWAHSEGSHNAKFGYGGSVGFDGLVANRIVIGPEFTYWHPNDGKNTVSTNVAGGGALYHRQGDQLSGDIRVGYLVTPDFLVFGKGGYVNEQQRRLFVAPVGQTGFDSRGHADGYQYGGGVEFTLHDKFSAVPGGLYVSAQYVRSQFDNHTADNHAMGGIGFRFK